MHYKYGELRWQNYSIGLCLMLDNGIRSYIGLLSSLDLSAMSSVPTEQNDSCFSMARRKRRKHCKSIWYPDLWCKLSRRSISWQHVTAFLWSDLLNLQFQLGNRSVVWDDDILREVGPFWPLELFGWPSSISMLPWCIVSFTPFQSSALKEELCIPGMEHETGAWQLQPAAAGHLYFCSTWS
jgi:hypothetical protein